MRKAVAVVLVLAAGVFLWWLLSFWIPGPSERVYLLLPPSFALIFVRTALNPWRRLRGQLARGITFVGCLGLLAAAYGWFWTRAISVPFVWVLPEIVIVTYFLVGTMLVIITIRGKLRGAGRGLARRWFGESLAGRLGRIVVAEALPSVLFVILTLAYLLGALHVHRFKIPNGLTPQSALGRAYDDVEFKTADGLTIRAWFIPARKASTRTVVICHGLGANRSLFLGHVKVCDALGANALLFDFRGHGDSDGHTVTMGHHESLDVQAAVHDLRRHRPEQATQIVGLGISMGAAALVRAAAELEQPFDAIILDSGFASAMDLTDNILSAYPAPLRICLTLPGVPVASLHAGFWLPDLQPAESIARVRAPVLVIHSRHDPLIPPAQGLRLYQNATGPKSLMLVDRGGHADILYAAEAEYLRAAVDLLAGPSGLTPK